MEGVDPLLQVADLDLEGQLLVMTNDLGQFAHQLGDPSDQDIDLTLQQRDLLLDELSVVCFELLLVSGAADALLDEAPVLLALGVDLGLLASELSHELFDGHASRLSQRMVGSTWMSFLSW